MKKDYHFCISGQNELICRTEPDYIRAFNCLAISAFKTNSTLLADAIMSNHIHVCIRSENIQSSIKDFRYSYTRYFNRKYGRVGSLGESCAFLSELQGYYHIMAVISYVLRNPVHHGVARTPFAYKYCSASAYFQSDMGLNGEVCLLPQKSCYKYLPKACIKPDHFLMGIDGQILRETVLDIVDVEYKYATVRSFLYYMNRLSGEEWRLEQEKDNISAPSVDISTIEPATLGQSVQEMLHNEHGKRKIGITDIELCSLVDNKLLPMYHQESVYSLSERNKYDLLYLLKNEYNINDKQARRCLKML